MMNQTYCARVSERVEVRLVQEVDDAGLVRRGLLDRRAFVAQNGRVDAISKAGGVSAVGVGTDPVVVDRLVSVELFIPSAKTLSRKGTRHTTKE